eukprot:scaffold62701_cov40-Phaeocystis_antarctica.AAC.2
MHGPRRERHGAAARHGRPWQGLYRLRRAAARRGRPRLVRFSTLSKPSGDDSLVALPLSVPSVFEDHRHSTRAPHDSHRLTHTHTRDSV